MGKVLPFEPPLPEPDPAPAGELRPTGGLTIRVTVERATDPLPPPRVQPKPDRRRP